MAFDDELGLLGYRLAQEKRDGTRTFSLARNRYLTYWLHLPADEISARNVELGHVRRVDPDTCPGCAGGPSRRRCSRCRSVRSVDRPADWLTLLVRYLVR